MSVPDPELVPASPAQRPILERLLQLYLHDFSEFVGDDVGPDGAFSYPWLERYCSEPGRHAFLLRVEGRWAGFVLLRGPSADTEGRWVIAEFFVLRKYRRRRIGERAATALFQRFPGPWLVCASQRNPPAIAFWKAVIHRYTCGRCREEPSGDGDVCWRFDRVGDFSRGTFGGHEASRKPS